MLKVLNKDGKLFGEKEVFMDALKLGDRMIPYGESFFIKEGKKQSDEIDVVFRSEISKYSKAIKDSKHIMKRMEEEIEKRENGIVD
ncbi:MAG: hypothetical protein KAS32_17275 [Candidatus Peribacteraceae bacterium]|nr:hypothetical protein [Candidatus Peribacteraceae bacterium]